MKLVLVFLIAVVCWHGMVEGKRRKANQDDLTRKMIRQRNKNMTKRDHICKRMIYKEYRGLSKEMIVQHICSDIKPQGLIDGELSLIYDNTGGHKLVFQSWIDEMTTFVRDEMMVVTDEEDDSDEAKTKKEDLQDMCQRKVCFKAALKEKFKASGPPNFCKERTVQEWMDELTAMKAISTDTVMTTEKMIISFCTKLYKPKSTRKQSRKEKGSQSYDTKYDQREETSTGKWHKMKRLIKNKRDDAMSMMKKVTKYQDKIY